MEEQGTYLTWLLEELDLLASAHPSRSLPKSGTQGQGLPGAQNISVSLILKKKNDPSEQATVVGHGSKFNL